MATKMRAKLVIRSIERYGTSTGITTQENLKFHAVSGDKPYGPNGENEDNTFARYTPMASLEMSILNPELFGKFKEGDAFYVDFTPVSAE